MDVSCILHIYFLKILELFCLSTCKLSMLNFYRKCLLYLSLVAKQIWYRVNWACVVKIRPYGTFINDVTLIWRFSDPLPLCQAKMTTTLKIAKKSLKFWNQRRGRGGKALVAPPPVDVHGVDLYFEFDLSKVQKKSTNLLASLSATCTWLKIRIPIECVIHISLWLQVRIRISYYFWD